MAELSQEDVKHIAHLARITVSDQEVEQYQKDLTGVLAYFEELNAVDTEGVGPIGHITGMTNVFREDRIEEAPEDEKAAMMANVPETNDGYISVKSVF